MDNQGNQKGAKRFSIRSRLLSFKYAFQGLKWLFLAEHNARIHAVAAVFAIAVGVVLGLSGTEWLFILSAIALVFMAELFNAALEHLADEVSPDYSPLIGKCKDFAAAAALVVACYALVVGGIVFLPKLFRLF